MLRRYAILDVFTNTPLAGNPLAIVRDAVGLSDKQMQAVAREFNLSETVFLLPPQNPVHSAQLRIFTPAGEMPFAGHPTVGTAVFLALEGTAHEAMLVLEEKVGPVRCGAFVKGDNQGRAIFDLPGEATEISAAPDTEAIAEALAMLPSEIGFENHVPSVFSAGAVYGLVPVRDLSVIAKARPDMAVWDETFGDEMPAAFLYCRETTVGGRHFHARMFAPSLGIHEDPATGGGVAALSGAIMRFDELITGSHEFVVEQGFEMGRPSLINLELDVAAGGINGARIGGDAVVVARGTLLTA